MISWRLWLALILSFTIFVVLLAVPLPWNEVSYIQQSDLHVEIRRLIYFSCAILAYGYARLQLRNTIVVSVSSAFFGPVYLMTIGFYVCIACILPLKGENNVR